MGPLQPEQGSSVVTSASCGNSGNTDANGNMGSSVTVSSPPRVVLWTRLPGQTCKIPEQDLYELEMVRSMKK